MYFAELKGEKGEKLENKAKNYLKKFDLLDRKDDKIDDLSKGNQQKIQFIITILHDPDFIILDEPFAGLDPINTGILKDIVLELNQQGKLVILSTHLMDFAERMCDHIAMIHHGKIILKGKLSEIKKEFGKRNVTIVHEGDISFLRENPIVERIENFGKSTGIKVKSHDDIQKILALLVEKGIVVKRFDANEISLHEIFVDLADDEEEEKNV